MSSFSSSSWDWFLLRNDSKLLIVTCDGHGIDQGCPSRPPNVWMRPTIDPVKNLFSKFLIFHSKSSKEQKKVSTPADVLFSTQNRVKSKKGRQQVRRCPLLTLVLRYSGGLAAQLNILVGNAAH